VRIFARLRKGSSKDSRLSTTLIFIILTVICSKTFDRISGIHLVSEKNCANLSFAPHLSHTECSKKRSKSVYIYGSYRKIKTGMPLVWTTRYEPISIKIVRIAPELALKKTVPKMPTSPKVCACTTLGNLKCQIEPPT